MRVSDADRVLTLPNALSLLRILLIPVFVALILRRGDEEAGLILLAGVVATDWVDGYIARHTNQVSKVGQILDPVADRLAILAALAALLARGAFPLWAALLVIVRDGLILASGGIVLWKWRARIDVRWLGKVATFALMCGIPLVAWGNFRLAFHDPAKVLGWVCYGIGITLYYAVAFVYAFDLIAAVRRVTRGA
jgi:cardiolipin synthase